MSRYVTPVKNIIKRAFTDYNDAAGHTDYFGAPDPYYFVTPEPLREYSNSPVRSPARRSNIQMRPTKRMRMTVRRRKRIRIRRVVRTKRKRVKRMFGKSARTEIGKPLGFKINVKSCVTSNVLNFDVGNQTLYSLDLDVIPFGSSKNQRDLDRVTIRGIRTEFAICNTMATVAAPTPNNFMCLNMAWVGLKQDTAANLELDFFKGYANERASAFSPINTLSMMRRELNTDKFAILKRKRYYMYPQQTGNSTQFVCRKVWVPVKRQIMFEAESDTQPKEGRMVLLFWVTGVFDPANTTRALTAEATITNIAFFTDGE